MGSWEKTERAQKTGLKSRTDGRRKKRFSVMVILAVLFFGFMGFSMGCSAKYGKLPAGQRLTRIENSPNYVNGRFENLTLTPMNTGNSSRVAMLWKFVFRSEDRLKPDRPLPMLKTDLLNLGRSQNVLVWLGHSSLFLQIEGKRILIDPVFSSNAAPFLFLNRAFPGYPYSPEDMPQIDYLLLTHDHWDHLDYPTVLALKSKVKNVICGLGVGSHLEYWGFDPTVIFEADWNETFKIEPGFKVNILPARHFSGRFLTQNKTLWVGFLLETAKRRIFISGDSGYDSHFAEIGRKFAPIDLAILENGQYNENWKYIHMMPEQVSQAALDLRAKALLPVHAGRFAMAYHAWDEPYVRLAEASSKQRGYELFTPIIGQIVNLDEKNLKFEYWWI
ncbi:MAG: MBL fold metallo-hydrolase [Deltaproteobacteria bacterium]|jgi:L-ascorbate metabolism protein UlaG (beta-lactamase superfamily)|nr:MBL fold metallo-hydrolase [Deltaproteobacteria bacterium]